MLVDANANVYRCIVYAHTQLTLGDVRAGAVCVIAGGGWDLLLHLLQDVLIRLQPLQSQRCQVDQPVLLARLHGERERERR